MPEPRGQRLWAVLLVVDAFFVIIFGGALGAKLYQHWQAPATAAAPARVRRAVKAPPPEAPKEVKEPKEAPKPAPVAEPVKAAAAKPARGKVIEIPQASDAPRPPKPSMIHEPPARQIAKLQGGAGASAAAAPAQAAKSDEDAAKIKALPIRFQLKSPSARSVELAGAFIVRGGKKSMSAQPDGTWTITVYLTPNTYRYWFLVNGKKTLDPDNANTDRGASVIAVAP